MMGRRPNVRQLSILDAFWDGPVVPEGSIYHLLAHADPTLLDDDAFAGLYAERGRPSYPPSLMVKVLLLAFHDQVGDRETEARCRYDLRWKYALNLGVNESGPDATTLARFRARLIANEAAGRAFYRILRWAQEAGWLPRQIDEIVDSSAVLGAGAVQDTFTLIRKATRRLATLVRTHPDHADWAQAILAQPDKKPDIDWSDQAARRKALNELVDQGREALQRTAGTELDAEGQKARQLLETVLGQDVEPDPEGGVRIRQGVARDRVCSVTDPEMRHGHKSSRGRFDGHKFEIGMDKATELITHVDVLPGNAPDGVHLSQRMDECEREAGLTIERVTGDHAYGRPAIRQAMEERGTVLIAPLPDPANRGWFTKDDFRIDLDQGQCVCPAGAQGRPRHNRQGQLVGFRFPAKGCAACPLRAQCTQSRHGRVISLQPDEIQRQRQREEQQTPSWKALYRQRSQIEHKIAELVRHGMRRARYIGHAKTQLQLFFTAAVVNLERLAKLMAASPVGETALMM